MTPQESAHIYYSRYTASVMLRVAIKKAFRAWLAGLPNGQRPFASRFIGHQVQALNRPGADLCLDTKSPTAWLDTIPEVVAMQFAKTLPWWGKYDWPHIWAGYCEKHKA